MQLRAYLRPKWHSTDAQDRSATLTDVETWKLPDNIMLSIWQAPIRICFERAALPRHDFHPGFSNIAQSLSSLLPRLTERWVDRRENEANNRSIAINASATMIKIFDDTRHRGWRIVAEISEKCVRWNELPSLFEMIAGAEYSEREEGTIDHCGREKKGRKGCRN